MQRSVNAWFFKPGTAPVDMARQCAEAGMEALELVVDEDGPITPTTDEVTCRMIGDQVRDAGVLVASLASGLFWRYSYGSEDPADRQSALDLTLAMLDRAVWLGTDAILVVPAVVGAWDDPKMRVSYSDALNRTHKALRQLVPEAEQRGVAIAIENVNVFSRFLLSPVETADLIDRVNSPWVGVYLDTANVLATGYPEDWIRVLGRRILRVHIKDYDLSKRGMEAFCAPFDGDVDWSAIIKALSDVSYGGPMTYEGTGDLSDIRARLDRIIVMRDS